MFNKNTHTDFRTLQTRLNSYFRYFSDLKNQNITKLNIDWLKTDQDQHLKLSLQNHLLLYKFFFNKEHSKLPRKTTVAGTL